MIKKIVFVSPPLTIEERYGHLGKGGANMPPIGLLYLGAVCKKAGYETYLIDATCPERPPEEVVQEIINTGSSIIGITASTMAIKAANNLALELKRINPANKVVIGGPHVSAVPVRTLERYKSFDIGVIGEGEITIVELLDTIANKGDLKKVNGIVFRENGSIVLTEKRSLIKNLDSLPFPSWELLPPLNLYKLSATRFQDQPTASLISSRGCFGTCTFCDIGVFGRIIRGHTSEYVIQMLEDLINNYNAKSLIFNDDTFAYNKKRLFEICDLIIKRFGSVSWSCSSRIDIMTPESLKKMQKSGCFQIAYGIESGDETILQQIGKKITLDKIRETIKLTEDAGIRSKGYFMVGFPNETKETIERTIDFALSLKLSDFQMTFLTPFPGCEIYRNANELGYFDDDWEHMNMWDIVFIPKGLSREILINSRNKAFRKFYLRQRIIKNYLKLILNRPKFIPLLVNDFISFSKMVYQKNY